MVRYGREPENPAKGKYMFVAEGKRTTGVEGVIVSVANNKAAFIISVSWNSRGGMALLLFISAEKRIPCSLPHCRIVQLLFFFWTA